MISNRELDYVGAWASKTPHPGESYAKATLEELQKAKELFESTHKDRVYNICFSNKSEIELEIMSKNLAHMLGIDYKNLNSDYHKVFRQNIFGSADDLKSYELLEKIIENGDSIIEYEKDNKKCILNYYQINIKCGIFGKIADLSKFNYGCINFDNDMYTNIKGKPFSGNSEKILYVPSEEVNAPYFMMGILKNNHRRYNDENNTYVDEPEDVYAVETLFAPKVENVKYFFDGQEVSIPTHLLYDDNGTFIKKEASPSEKLEQLRLYKTIIYEYGLYNNLNIQGDYELLLQTADNAAKKLVRK